MLVLLEKQVIGEDDALDQEDARVQSDAPILVLLRQLNQAADGVRRDPVEKLLRFLHFFGGPISGQAERVAQGLEFSFWSFLQAHNGNLAFF